MPRRGDRASAGDGLSAGDIGGLAVPLVIIVAAVLISFIAGFSLGLNRADRVGSLELGPIDVVPSEDLPGEDVPGLQRYPGVVRVEYESHLLGDTRVSEVGYLARGDFSKVGGGKFAEGLKYEARNNECRRTYQDCIRWDFNSAHRGTRRPSCKAAGDNLFGT